MQCHSTASTAWVGVEVEGMGGGGGAHATTRMIGEEEGVVGHTGRRGVVGTERLSRQCRGCGGVQNGARRRVGGGGTPGRLPLPLQAATTRCPGRLATAKLQPLAHGRT